MRTKHPINWLNTLFLILTPIIGLFGTAILYAKGHPIPWQTWCFTAVFFVLNGLAITAGYHRLYAHKSYRAHGVIRGLFLMIASAAFQGSVLEWCTDHRDHHRYSDTEKDLYTIKKGFWSAHILWLFRLQPQRRDYSNVADIMQDPIARFQHRFIIPLGILFAFVCPMILCALWHDALGGLIVAGALRITLNHHTTFAINSICHLFGKKTYSQKESAVDNWITALVTFGEGFHNFHHRFPIDYRNGIRFYHYDPTKWLIRLLAMLGLARDLKTVSEKRILQQKMLNTVEQAEKNLAQQPPTRRTQYETVLGQLRQSTQTIFNKLEHLEQQYRALKEEKLQLKSASEKKCLRKQLKSYRRIIKANYQELKHYLALWHELDKHWRIGAMA